MFQQMPTETIKRKSKKLLHFDKCVFPYCPNGKHNGHILFRLPVNPRRQQQWLNTIGNPLLEGYSRNYLASKAGVCKYHFDPDDFTNSQQNKLQRCVFPLRPDVQSIANCHASALNLCVSDNYQRNCSTPKAIGGTDNGVYTNNLSVRDYEKIYLPNAVSPVYSIKDNDENMNFASDRGKAQKSFSSFRADVIDVLNRRIAETNSNFEPGASLNDCALECNPYMAGVFRKSEAQISVSPVIVDASNDKELRKDTSALKEKNIILKRKLTNDAKVKREKLHSLVKLMNDRKNVQGQRNY